MNTRPTESTLTTRGRPRGLVGGIIGVAALSLTLTTGVAKGDVLYDTLSMTDTNSYSNAAQNYIGGLAQNSQLWDVQVADDFTLGNAHQITSVTADFLTTPGATPAGGVLVEFFSDIGGAPSAGASVALLTSNYTTSVFNNHIGSLAGLRFSIDLVPASIVLGPGNWWIAVTPVDETENGARYFSVRQLGMVNGASAHRRNGGEAHGNGYVGGWGTPDWLSFGIGGGSNNALGDIAMRIEGAFIPAPGVIAIFCCAALFPNVRRRRIQEA